MKNKNPKGDQLQSGSESSAQALYDLIMAQIEPELTSWALAMHEEWFANETREQKAERMERYNRAFEKFQERFSEVLARWERELASSRKQVVAGLQKKSYARDTSALEDIDRTMQSL